MRQEPLRSKTQQQPQSQISQSRSVVAPTGGWYVGTPLAAAPDRTAFLLENAFPEIDYVRMRGGSIPFATGMGAFTVTALMPWTDGVTRKMFASINGKIFDVTNAGAVGAALVTGLNVSAVFVYIQYSGLGGQTLLAANGFDPVQLYNGTVWGTTPAITGLTGNQLSYLWAYKHRIYGIERNSLNVWYGGVDAIGGAFVLFPMAPLFVRGGKLIAGGAWVNQSSSGLIQTCIFVTDRGEIAVFSGTFPGDASWTVQGIYDVSPPVGQKCLFKAGGDIGIMTQDGIVPMSKVITLDQVGLQNQAVTIAIQPAWRDAVQARLGTPGWQIINWPAKTMAIVALPKATAGDKTQFVANERTGAWCKYSGWDANCFEVGGANLEQLFYGTSDGRVMRAETGGQDDGGPYTTTIFPSFADLSATDIGFRSLSQSAGRKQTKMVRARIQSNAPLSPQITMKVDYDTSIPPFPSSSFGAVPGPQWGIALWGIALWGQGIFLFQIWGSASAIGSTVSPVIQLTSNSSTTPDVRLASTDILFEQGTMFG